MLKTWEKSPIANLMVEDSYFVQFWKSGAIAIWQHGIKLDQAYLKGDIVSNQQYLKGDFQAYWCPTGSFIYAGNNLYRVLRQNGILTSKLVLRDIKIESLACMYYLPKSNTYYLGSKTNGLYVVKVSDFFVPVIPPQSGTGNFYAVAKLPGDTIIVKNTIIPAKSPAYYRGINDNNFIAAYVDSSGVMYYDVNYVLTSFDAKSGIIKEILHIDEHLVSVIPLANNRLLLCTHASVWIVSKTGEVYLKQKLPIDYDNVMARGLFPLSGNLYMLLTSKGADWYNLNTNTFERTILDSISLRSYYLDDKGRSWFGSDGFGGYMYDKGKTYALPLGPNNAFKSIHAFIDDQKGYFWLTTNNGLYKANIDDLASNLISGIGDNYFYTLDKSDGLPTNEFNGGAYPAYQWLSDGKLVLPSMHGLVEFNPDSLLLNYSDKPIFIDQISIDSSIIHLTDLEDITKLKPDFNLLEIKVSCPYFGNNRNLVLVYQIVGEEQKNMWLRLPPTGLINVNRLPAGDFKVIIKKLGRQTDIDTNQLTLHFAVMPYFYNTWWFYILMLALCALTGYIISRRHIASLKKKNLEIEQIVTARTSELLQTTHKLEISEKALKQSNKVKEQIIALVLHDLRSPIRFLGTISQNVVHNFMERPKKQNLDTLMKLHKSVGMLWSFIEQFFAWAISQQNAFRVKIAIVKIQDVFNNVTQFYHEILIFNGNELAVASTNLTWNTDQDILTMIVRNLLDNANKYTENGQIWISATVVQDKLRIIVKDSGRGLNERQVQHFMDAVNEEHREGNGSLVILQMLKKIGGELTIKTKAGEGSQFIIDLEQIKLPPQLAME